MKSDKKMKRSRERILARKSAAILVFLALAVNQWRSIVVFHRTNPAQESEGGGEIPPREENHNRHRFNSTKDSANQQQRRRQRADFVVVNEVIHRAFYGLGHRLHRSAAAYHLAQALSLPLTESDAYAYMNADLMISDQYEQQPVITHLRFNWESCLADGDKGNVTVLNGEEEKTEYNIFRYLFGDDVWVLSDPFKTDSMSSKISSSDNYSDNDNDNYNYNYNHNDNDNDNYNHNTSRIPNKRNMILLRNDVPGYINGQLYKDLDLPVRVNRKDPSLQTNDTKSLSSTTTASSNPVYGYEHILDKLMHSDVHFYRRLIQNYRFQSELRDFERRHKWSERPLVVGLHLREGNGERGHFVESGRAAPKDHDEATMIARLVQLINKVTKHEIDSRRKQIKDQRWQQQHNPEESNLSSLLFVATDTAHLIPMIEKAVTLAVYDDNITRPVTRPLEVVTWPQYRLPKNAGVGFDTLRGKGDRCLESWKSAVSDILMLSKVDVLIAQKGSTFTQSLPITLGFDRNRDGDEINKSGGTDFASEDATSTKRRFSFCEVSESDTARISCFPNMRKWLFRGEDEQNGIFNAHEGQGKNSSSRKMNPGIWTFEIDGAASQASDKQPTNEHVQHKLSNYVPDVERTTFYTMARKFLRRESAYDPNTTSTDSQTEEKSYVYGFKIDRKYRKLHQKKQARASPTAKNRWKFAYDT